jgi:uncharacterized circularly permuted ATP-grasp superfamily protein
MLLEGDDLVVDDGPLMVRTVSGPKPVSVLWRRLDAAMSDPLELGRVRAFGTPGLLGAVRSQGVTMINALGSGVLETRAFLAFLPRSRRSCTASRLRSRTSRPGGAAEKPSGTMSAPMPAKC